MKINLQTFFQCWMLVVAGLFFSGPVKAEKITVGVHQLLDVSLGALRKRAEDVQTRNQWIRDEMLRLPAGIRRMQAELAELTEAQRTYEDGEAAYAKMFENLNLMEKKVLRTNMSLDQLRSESRRLQAQRDAQLTRRQQMEERLAGLLKSIEGLRAGKPEVVVTDSENVKDVEVARYRMLVEQSVISLERTQREYEHLLRKYERPLQKVQRLKVQKEEILLQVQLLEDEIRVSFEEEAILERDIENARRTRQQEIGVLQAKLASLKVKQAELDQVLSRAKSTIENRNLVFEGDPNSAVSLEENLSIITEQNLVLKSQLNSLQSTLQNLNK